MRFVIALLGLTTVLFGGLPTVFAAPEEPRKIKEAEIKSAINDQSDVDRCASLDQIQIDHLEYFDFTGDGKPEAVVVASTCMTGTAGPDVHAVYAQGPDGKLIELPFLDARGDPPYPNGQTPVFGNPNYGLTVEDGRLVVHWRDSSDREAPVTLWYKWNGKKFVMDRMKIEGPFPTSYDCAKATKEMDRAICYSPAVAALDAQLGQTYRNLLQHLTRDRKQKLQTQQREWLAHRENECTIYKWWVDCLTDLYTKRIAEMRQSSGAEEKNR